MPLRPVCRRNCTMTCFWSAFECSRRLSSSSISREVVDAFCLESRIERASNATLKLMSRSTVFQFLLCFHPLELRLPGLARGSLRAPPKLHPGSARRRLRGHRGGNSLRRVSGRVSHGRVTHRRVSHGRVIHRRVSHRRVTHCKVSHQRKGRMTDQSLHGPQAMKLCARKNRT